MTAPQWLTWAQKLQSIAQIGLTYAQDPYDQERYKQIRELAVEIIDQHTEATPKQIRGLFESQMGYATPKVDVRGVVFRDDQILLVHEKMDGKWTLPGGWADVGDSPAAATEREVLEEAGYEVKTTKLLMLHDRNKRNRPPSEFATYKLFFLCEIVGGDGQIIHQHETLDVGFFAEDALPPLSTARVTIEQIKRLFEHHRQPDLPTDFD